MACLKTCNAAPAGGRVTQVLKLFITAVSISVVSAHTQAEPHERSFASQALAVRQSALESNAGFSVLMNQMPGSRILDSEVLSYLWTLSFSNMIVKLGRHRSEAPVSLYYDPLLDIAVLVFWERDEADYHAKTVRALPGEWLGSGMQESSVLPSWISDENALSALIRTTSERLYTFAQMHPAGSLERGMNDAAFAESATGMRSVIPRLIWNENHRAQWSEAESSYQWLSPVLAEVEQALYSSSSDHIMGIAPETDPDIAEVLAELPEEYVDELTLDLVIGTQGHRLLAASSAADGDTYIMILCQVDKLSCRPERFMLISLVD